MTLRTLVAYVLVPALSGIFLATTESHATLVAVTTCGQSVKASGFLTGDLDCSASSGPAVNLERNARLFLSGFTLTGNLVGVHCDLGTCRVLGPGTIRRTSLDANVDNRGVSADLKARISDVVLENWRFGALVLGPVTVARSVVQGNSFGVGAYGPRVVDSTFSNNGQGIRAFEKTPNGILYLFSLATAIRSTFTANTIDIAAFRRPHVRNTTCTTSAHLTVPPTTFSGGDEWGVCS